MSLFGLMITWYFDSAAAPIFLREGIESVWWGYQIPLISFEDWAIVKEAEEIFGKVLLGLKDGGACAGFSWSWGGVCTGFGEACLDVGVGLILLVDGEVFGVEREDFVDDCWFTSAFGFVVVDVAGDFWVDDEVNYFWAEAWLFVFDEICCEGIVLLGWLFCLCWDGDWFWLVELCGWAAWVV